MAKTRTRIPAATRLPVATAVSASVQLAPDTHGHPVLLEVMFLDHRGEPVILPVRLTSELSGAAGLQLDRVSRVARTLGPQR